MPCWLRGELVLKLAEERASAIVAAGSAAYFDPGHERSIKEWNTLRPTTYAAWLGLAREAMDFVNPEAQT
ncbi:MAG: hypothetical protein IIC78_09710 [Chloroflexi bacterium]|nr:hypothetical protein [Chloroflexota bacterium]